MSWCRAKNVSKARGAKAGQVLVTGQKTIRVTVEEASQLLLATRSFSLLDLACDYAGILCLGRRRGAAGDEHARCVGRQHGIAECHHAARGAERPQEL